MTQAELTVPLAASLAIVAVCALLSGSPVSAQAPTAAEILAATEEHDRSGSTAAMQVRSLVLLAMSRKTSLGSACGVFPYFLSHASRLTQRSMGLMSTRNCSICFPS